MTPIEGAICALMGVMAICGIGIFVLMLVDCWLSS